MPFLCLSTSCLLASVVILSDIWKLLELKKLYVEHVILPVAGRAGKPKTYKLSTLVRVSIIEYNLLVCLYLTLTSEFSVSQNVYRKRCFSITLRGVAVPCFSQVTIVLLVTFS